MDTMDKIHSGILRKFHTLCSKMGMEAEDKKAIIRSYGVESSADIDTHDLIDLCASLSKGLHNDTVDVMRKRVMASVGGYLRKSNIKGDAVLIKSIACRSTGYKNFNAIPVERLRNVYNTFLNKQKDIDAVAKIDSDVAMERLVRDFSLN